MKKRETIFKNIFFLTALTSVIAVLLICIFLFVNGIPGITKIGLFEFLFGQKWAPGNQPASYGILPMILGSIYITLGAVLIGVPIGLLTAIFMAKYCPKKIYPVLKSAIELLSGIPSVVYGFFGLMILVPLIRTVLGGSGNSILTAAILLGIMILPTIVGVSEAAIQAVPDSYYEGAVALGASHDRAVFTAVVPAAKSGILAAVVLGIGRSIGETMAVIMVAGNQARIPTGLLNGARTMTANIVLEMGYASGVHREALIATGVVLFVFILIINFVFAYFKRKDNQS